MVAAWISALTGVGPSMASGSQVCSGTWADLANAPTSSSTQPATRSGWSTREDLVDLLEGLQEVERAGALGR